MFALARRSNHAAPVGAIGDRERDSRAGGTSRCGARRERARVIAATVWRTKARSRKVADFLDKIMRNIKGDRALSDSTRNHRAL